MIAVGVLDEPPVEQLPAGMLPMGWLSRTAVAIAATDAPEDEFGHRAAELAAAGVARLGAEEVRRRADRARVLTLETADPRDVRKLAATWQRIGDLWGSSERMRAAYGAAWSLADRVS